MQIIDNLLEIWEKSFVKSVFVIGFGTFLSQILGLLLLILLANSYSVQEYGYINYIISSGTILATLVSAGFPTALVFFLSKNHTDKEMKNVYFSNTSFLTLALLLLVLIITIIIYGFNVEIIAVMIGYSIIYLYLGIIRGLLDVNKIAFFTLIRNIIILLIFLFFTYILSFKNTSLFIFLYAFGGWAVILLLELSYPTSLKYHTKLLSKKIMKEISIFSLPLSISVLAYAVLSNIPIIIVNFSSEYYEVGLFASAMTLATIFGIIPYALVMVLMPLITRTHSNKIRQYYIRLSIFLVLLSGILMFLVTLFFGKELIMIIFTGKYIDSYDILVILAAGGIFSGLRLVFSALWEGMGRPILSAYAIAIASIGCIFASLILVNLFGPIGVAYGYCIGFIFGVIVDLIFWRKYMNNVPENKNNLI